jgi:hypothetical protein
MATMNHIQCRQSVFLGSIVLSLRLRNYRTKSSPRPSRFIGISRAHTRSEHGWPRGGTGRPATAGALGEIGRHRVRRIAQHRDPPGTAQRPASSGSKWTP